MVNTRPPVITPAEIDAWKRRINPETRRHYTQAEIAEMYGVTPSYISMVKHKTDGFVQTGREAAMEHFPWKGVGMPWNKRYIDKMLRYHAEYWATGGEGMSPYWLRKLNNWYHRLRDNNLVVEFTGESTGYEYQPREKRDGELIIRVNDLAEMTDQAYVIWRFPPALPEELEE